MSIATTPLEVTTGVQETRAGAPCAAMMDVYAAARGDTIAWASRMPTVRAARYPGDATVGLGAVGADDGPALNHAYGRVGEIRCALVSARFPTATCGTHPVGKLGNDRRGECSMGIPS